MLCADTGQIMTYFRTKYQVNSRFRQPAMGHRPGEEGEGLCIENRIPRNAQKSPTVGQLRVSLR